MSNKDEALQKAAQIIEQIKWENQILTSQNEELQEKVRNCEICIKGKLEDVLAEMQNQIDNLILENEEYSSKMKHQELKIQQLIQQLGNMEQNKDLIIQELQAKIQSHESDIQMVKKYKEQFQIDLNTIKSPKKVELIQNRKFFDDLQISKKEIELEDELNSYIVSLKNEMDSVFIKSNSFQSSFQLEEFNQFIEEVQANYKTQMDKMDDLFQQNQDYKSIILTFQEQYKSLQQNFQELQFYVSEQDSCDYQELILQLTNENQQLKNYTLEQRKDLQQQQEIIERLEEEKQELEEQNQEMRGELEINEDEFQVHRSMSFSIKKELGDVIEQLSYKDQQNQDLQQMNQKLKKEIQKLSCEMERQHEEFKNQVEYQYKQQQEYKLLLELSQQSELELDGQLNEKQYEFDHIQNLHFNLYSLVQRLIQNVNKLMGFDQWQNEDVEENIKDLENSIIEYFNSCFQYFKKILSQIYEHKIPYNLIEDITQKNLLLILKNTQKELEDKRFYTQKHILHKDTSGFIKKQLELR